MKLTNTDNISQKTAKILLKTKCVNFNPRHPYKFTSGILSPIYVDNRRLISLPRERDKIISFFIEKIKRIGLPDTIAGAATAGIPHAAWIAEKLNMPMVYVRPQPKEHGKGNQVEGIIKKGQRVLVVEDMVSTAGSSIVIINALRKIGAKVTDQIAIYTHTLKEAVENFKEAKVKFHSLTDLNEVVKAAVNGGFLKSSEIKIIHDWVKDPKNWKSF